MSWSAHRRLDHRARAGGRQSVRHDGRAAGDNSQPIARSRDKLRSLQLLSREGLDIPKTVMASDPSQIHRALEIVGGPPAVLKVVKGTQG